MTPQPKQQPKQQPRNEQGQFTSQQEQENHVRADMLARQAQKIKANQGLDVMAAFNENEDVKNKIISGEWDFYDVAEAMQKPRKKAPAPMRSPMVRAVPRDRPSLP